MTTTTIELKVLTADEGKLLTNGETYSSEVILGSVDSPDNWYEINADQVPAEENIL